MEYTVQNLEYAVSVFYNGEPEERAKAHTWLTTAQRVPEAWNFVWDLLQPTKGTEVQFYAATTLHTKILRCWNELPPESYEELQNKILQYVITYANGPKIVTNRLCISLAAFILQQETMNLALILSPLTTSNNTSLLLDVLTVLPEEYNSMTMGATQRSKNRTGLYQASAMVIEDMLKIFQNVYNDYSNSPPSEEIMKSWTIAAGCVSSWLSLGGEHSLDSPIPLPDRAPILHALQTAIHVLYTTNGVVSGSALETCEACLSALRVTATHGDTTRYENVVTSMLADLASLVTPVITNYNVPDSVNEELLCAMITCCVSVGECHTHALVRSAEAGGAECGAGGAGGGHLLRLLLEVQAAPGFYPLQESRSNLMFGFWYTLQDEILNMTDGTQKMHPIWGDVFSQLLLALITKSEMPPESELSRDDQELLRCYRQDIGDAVMYCFTILGDRCWDIVSAAFEASAKEARREAVLHALGALADVAQHGAPPAPLPGLLRRALQLVADTRDRRTLDTALDCIGTYAAWISSMEIRANGNGVEESLGVQCVRAAGSALPRSPVAAALALRRLAADCSRAAAALVQDIVQAALNAEGVSDAWVRRQLTSAAGAALAACDHDTALPLLRLLAENIATQISTQVPEGGCVAAECGAALMGALSSKPPLAAELFRMLLPSLALLTQHPILTDALFQILKQTVSALMGDSAAFMDEIAQLTIAGFNAQPCASGLDLVKLIVLMVGEECEQAKLVLTSCVCATARLLVPELPATPAGARPDLVEGLFYTLQMLTRRKSHYIDWIESYLPDLVKLACRSVRLWEARAARSACMWLSVLAANRPRALRDSAPALTYATLRCIGGATPRNQVEPLAELLLSLNRAAWGSDELAAWLRHALSEPDFPTRHATPVHKHNFVDAVLREKSSKRRLLQTVQEFSLVCRGLVGTEYARQSIASKQLVA